MKILYSLKIWVGIYVRHGVLDQGNPLRLFLRNKLELNNYVQMEFEIQIIL